jgi:hypothetical protein
MPEVANLNDCGGGGVDSWGLPNVFLGWKKCKDQSCPFSMNILKFKVVIGIWRQEV